MLFLSFAFLLQIEQVYLPRLAFKSSSLKESTSVFKVSIYSA
ncbi:hypothetical protein [Brachyspira hyodysenteriae]|nr:hypothetical protein [Brachyspira hyodysenteriae]MCZ9948266.1 hypothetical protein [Brachyspira hyodysenteriae]